MTSLRVDCVGVANLGVTTTVDPSASAAPSDRGRNLPRQRGDDPTLDALYDQCALGSGQRVTTCSTCRRSARPTSRSPSPAATARPSAAAPTSTCCPSRPRPSPRVHPRSTRRPRPSPAPRHRPSGPVASADARGSTAQSIDRCRGRWHRSGCPADDSTRAELDKAFIDPQGAVLPRPAHHDRQHVAFCRGFGQLEVHPFVRASPGTPRSWFSPTTSPVGVTRTPGTAT